MQQQQQQQQNFMLTGSCSHPAGSGPASACMDTAGGFASTWMQLELLAGACACCSTSAYGRVSELANERGYMLAADVDLCMSTK